MFQRISTYLRILLLHACAFTVIGSVFAGDNEWTVTNAGSQTSSLSIHALALDPQDVDKRFAGAANPMSVWK